jgi:hypothetical protein
VFGKASSVGKASSRGTASHVSIRNGKAVLSIRCHGAVGSVCKGSLVLSAGKMGARVPFSVGAGKTRHVSIALPSALVAAALGNGTSGVVAKVTVSTHNTGKAADVRRASVTLVG